MSAIAILMMLVSIAIYIGNFQLKDQFIRLLELFQSQDMPQDKDTYKRLKHRTFQMNMCQVVDFLKSYLHESRQDPLEN